MGIAGNGGTAFIGAGAGDGRTGKVVARRMIGYAAAKNDITGIGPTAGDWDTCVAGTYKMGGDGGGLRRTGMRRYRRLRSA